MQAQLLSIQKYKKKTYENYVDAILDKEEYLSYKTEYEQQEQNVRDKMEQLEKERNSIEAVEENYENWVESFIKYGELKEITREIIVELVEKIVVYGDNRIDIEFKYQSPYVA